MSKFKELLITLNNNKITLTANEKNILLSDKDFIDYCDSQFDWDYREHDYLLKLLAIDKDDENYSLDAFGNRISFNGNKLIKKSGTKLILSHIHENEIKKCSQNFNYFRKFYVKIVTNHGVDRPDVREYQERLERDLLEHSEIAVSFPRQSGKSVTVGTYLLWEGIFREDIVIGIAAQKARPAREVLSKIRQSFTLLPIWIMPGVTTFNKTRIDLENGCKFLTDSTNIDSFRGDSCNIIFADECAYIRPQVWKDFTDAILPTQAALSFTKTIFASTANGFNHWYHIVQKAKKNRSKIGWKLSQCSWKEVPRFDKKGNPISHEEFKKREIAKNSLVYWNQAHENQFLGSSNTLLSSEALGRLESEEPLYINKIINNLSIYKEPVKDKKYIIGVDPNKDGLDKVGIQVIDISQFPFEQVASANLDDSYITIAGKLFDVGTYYNNALIIIENNIDQSIVDSLFINYEYENVFRERGKKLLGFRTTTRTKRLTLSHLKKFIEEDKLKIYDRATIDEMFVFIENGKGSFSAEEGYHDDLVMSLAVCFAPFLDIYVFDDFKTFLEKLENKKIEGEKEDDSILNILSLGFSDFGGDEPPVFEDGPIIFNPFSDPLFSK